MSCCIIACKTLEKELLAAMSAAGCTYPVRWLEAGQHNRKDARRAEIQAALDQCGEFDTVLLAASLCGNLVVGLESHDFRLVIPRCDDCITLLLGSEETRNGCAGTYFLTAGWLSGRDNLRSEYLRSLEKHGETRTRRIFSAMLANYRQMAFVDTGCTDVSTQVRELAGLLGLTYTRIPGTCSYLEELLSGPWEWDRFLVLEPNCTLTEAMCRPPHRVTLVPENRTLFAPHGTNLLALLQKHNLAPDAPCGGSGKCGKCAVLVDGQEVRSCRTEITRDLTVTVPQKDALNVLQSGIDSAVTMNPVHSGDLLAFDIGTTSVVCCLLDGKTGLELASAGAANPQGSYGADVISRIRQALQGNLPRLQDSIRSCMTDLAGQVCRDAGRSLSDVGVVSVVGNPAMQQLFLGIAPHNLAAVPFAPVLTEAKTAPCAPYLPCCPDALLLTVPDISGYVGADTLGCILATKLHEQQDITLLVDIGTNGELVLGNRERMIACATAAGPALEGANIPFGMRAAAGAIDHVWIENGNLRCSVIGGGKAMGICGSGLIDAVAAALELGLLNRRGRIRNEERIIPLADGIYLTQEDIRQVQLAKGAIHAGIRLMAQQMGIQVTDIQNVLLAGAFGAHMDPKNACRMGLLPPELEGRITPAGNAACAGAKMIARDRSALALCQQLAQKTEFLELASLPEFPKAFARAMGFSGYI